MPRPLRVTLTIASLLSLFLVAPALLVAPLPGMAANREGGPPPRATLPQPSEQELGAPVYPGAKYDGELSAGMSGGGDWFYWIFLTNDPPGKVAKFYEEKTQVKPEKMEGSYIFALKGKPPIPEHGIVIEPNTMFPPPAKAVITVARKNSGD